MALLHRATLRPTKLELLTGWLPGRSWYDGPAGVDVARVAGYRFDDPAGAVGIETLLVRAGDGPVHQVPLTYRDAPLDGGDDWLIGTTEHSVLGRRWVYDACGDPVYAAALAAAILAGTGQAQEYVEADGVRELRPPTMAIDSSGADRGDLPPVGTPRRVVDADPALIVTDTVELTVVRRLDRAVPPAGAALTGTWEGQPTPVPLAYATVD
ncbi:CG0192-related protein [Micromonospora sp. URMC 105]|uniref:CG0192-related protein n=1 Tax=Micromonospora sp. URMC 105 TaxID=3423413 RepID=UPI003F1DA464